ncbi:hypothetical protein JXA88_09660 [Candidatus Fermentibacteria bacterium]|nr:hypothetical protein [Candidatus Fermentibacteria bacterium]
MKVLRYDYRDMFGAASLGLRVRKWLVALPGMLVAVLWWAVMAWMALLVRGVSPALVWNAYGPVPWPSRGSLDGTLSPILWGLAIAGSAVAWLLACSAVSRVTYHQLKGNDFYSFFEAWRFALRKWKAVVLPGLILGVGGGILALSLVALSLLGGLWLPIAGIFFPLGLLAASALLYLFMVSCTGLCMGPAVVASSGSEALETAFELFSIQSGQGKRAWLYSTLNLAIAAVHTVALGVFLGIGSLLTSWVFDMGRAGAIGRLLRASLAWAPRVAHAVNGVPGALDSLFLGVSGGVASPYRAYLSNQPASIIGGVALAVLFLAIFLLLLAQFTATFATGQTTAYVVLRQLKDEQNLLEEDLGE